MTKIEPVGPDPLITVIRRNFAAYAAQYGVEQAGDTGPLLREIDRLEVLLAESANECNCSGKSDEAAARVLRRSVAGELGADQNAS